MAEFVDLLPLADVTEKRGVAVTCAGRELLVCKTGDSVHVLDNLCPHQDQALTSGRVRNGFIFCPFHGMRFRLETGEALGHLTRIPLTLHKARVKDGQIQVQIDSE